jgi:hypothetical protein
MGQVAFSPTTLLLESREERSPVSFCMLQEMNSTDSTAYYSTLLATLENQCVDRENSFSMERSNGMQDIHHHHHQKKKEISLHPPPLGPQRLLCTNENQGAA